MNLQSWNRLFNYHNAFDHPVTLGITILISCLLIITPIVLKTLMLSGKISDKLKREIYLRYYSWLVITPCIMVPILLGACWTILAVLVLSMLCFREYARVTGLFREKVICLCVVTGIILVNFAALDHWHKLFTASFPIAMVFISMVAILKDQPKGYIQRVSLGLFGFSMFGTCFGHISYLANETNYRPILLLLFLATELNDIFAFIAGKTFGENKLVPQTSPGKTIAGSLGAVVSTTMLMVILGHYIFPISRMQSIVHLTILGLQISIMGQFGDLILSSIKRDIGIKDMANSIPGHGGFLDRFDSIILVGPVVFHYLNYFKGVGVDEPIHVFTSMFLSFVNKLF